MFGVKIPLFGLAADASLLLGAVSFTNTISTGVIILTAIAAAATVVGVIYGIRYKTSYLTEKATREALDDRVRGLAHERDDYKNQLAELQQKLEEATNAIADARATIARLEPLKDMGAVLEMVTKTFERLRDRTEALHMENKIQADRNLKIVLDAVHDDAAESRP